MPATDRATAPSDHDRRRVGNRDEPQRRVVRACEVVAAAARRDSDSARRAVHQRHGNIAEQRLSSLAVPG
jgi:hypothetical protein